MKIKIDIHIKNRDRGKICTYIIKIMYIYIYIFSNIYIYGIKHI